MERERERKKKKKKKKNLKRNQRCQSITSLPKEHENLQTNPRPNQLQSLHQKQLHCLRFTPGLTGQASKSIYNYPKISTLLIYILTIQFLVIELQLNS